MNFAEELATVNRYRAHVPVDIEGLAGALGIKIKGAFLGKDISGILEHSKSDGYVISVNASHSEARRRFTIAHELGHYLLHKQLVGDGIGDDKAYRSTSVGKYHNTAIGAYEETQANKFAASLLMPMDLIDEIKKSEGIDDPATLAKRFNVSEHAMCIRLGVPYEPAF